MRLSPSAINTYNNCPRRFYYNYVLYIKEAENIYAVRGRIVHKVLEQFFRVKLGTKKSYKKTLRKFMLDLFERHWQDLKLHLVVSSEVDKQFYEESKIMLLGYLDRVIRTMDSLLVRGKCFNPAQAFGYVKPKILESKLRVEKYNISGIIDAIEENFDKDITLVDFKTSARFRHEIKDDYRNQLDIYAFLYYKNFGKIPKFLVIDYLLYGNNVVFPCDESNVTRAEELIKDIISKVQTKEIKDYPKNPTKLCDWCGHKERCNS